MEDRRWTQLPDEHEEERSIEPSKNKIKWAGKRKDWETEAGEEGGGANSEIKLWGASEGRFGGFTGDEMLVGQCVTAVEYLAGASKQSDGRKCKERREDELLQHKLLWHGQECSEDGQQRKGRL